MLVLPIHLGKKYITQSNFIVSTLPLKKGRNGGWMNSRQKGAAGERELAKILRGYGYDCRRGQQYCGVNGDADVVGLPGIHIECKRVEHLNIQKALEQAQNDATDGEMPAVIHRKNREPWKVTVDLGDFMKLYIAAGELFKP